MPTKATMTSSKKVSKKAPKPVNETKYLKEVRALANLTTLKHSKREHEANFELFDTRQELVALSKSGWTAKDAGRVLLIKKLVERGKFSDFPKMKQRAGALALGNLGDA